MSDENKLEGTVRNVAGRVQEAVGGVTGDVATKMEGKVRQAAGKAQAAYGDATDRMRGVTNDVSRTISEQPLTALVVAGVVGYILGRLVPRS